VRRKLVLFDIDGTILLTAGAGRRAIVAALAEEVADTSAFDRIRFDGKTDPQIVAEMLEAAGRPEPRESPRVRALCRRYVGVLARELERRTTRTTVMPGVHPLLDRLEAEAGVVLGLLTGNLAEGAALKLRSGGIDPATPPRHGERVVRALGPMARHVVVANAGHGVLAIGCMRDVVFRFIDAASADDALAVDAGCASTVPRPPAFRPVAPDTAASATPALAR
jgi:phosphoglycolate phosphatase-like HAD superfamily hydrolase